MLQLLFNGIAMGAIYALVALGFVMLYNATNVINFAHGEIVALGAYLCLFAALSMGFTPLGALGAAAAGMALLAPLIFLIAFYPVRDRPLLAGVVGTIGVGIALKNILLVAAGPLPHTLTPVFGRGMLDVGGVMVPLQSLGIIAVAAVMFAAHFCYSHLTLTGIMVRASAQDREMARMVGIPVDRMMVVTFVLSCVIATVAGFLVAPIVLISPDMGLPLMLKGFIAIVVGGFGSIPGAIIGGFFVGVLESLTAAHISSTYRDVFTFLAFIAVMVLMPTGFFGERASRRV